MATHVAFLRGINVGGHHKVPMKDLRALLSELGLGAPGPLLASGNAWFDAERGADRAQLQERLASAIEARFGFPVPTIVRPASEVIAVHEGGHPFVAAPKNLHVFFLGAVPEPDPDKEPDGPETLELRGTELFVHYVNGAGKSKLTTGRIERWLGVTATSRNWNTVGKVAEKVR
jgi:uncharacterized protein (DUF1697 family)